MKWRNPEITLILILTTKQCETSVINDLIHVCQTSQSLPQWQCPVRDWYYFTPSIWRWQFIWKDCRLLAMSMSLSLRHKVMSLRRRSWRVIIWCLDSVCTDTRPAALWNTLVRCIFVFLHSIFLMMTYTVQVPELCHTLHRIARYCDVMFFNSSAKVLYFSSAMTAANQRFPLQAEIVPACWNELVCTARRAMSSA